MIVHKRVFRSDSWDAVNAAGELLRRDCFSSVVIRGRWVRTLGRAMKYLNGYEGDRPEKANGRKYEFRKLQKALMAYREY